MKTHVMNASFIMYDENIYQVFKSNERYNFKLHRVFKDKADVIPETKDNKVFTISDAKIQSLIKEKTITIMPYEYYSAQMKPKYR